MVQPKLDAHYSVLSLISRVAFCLGVSVLFWFYVTHFKQPIWFIALNYVGIVGLTGAALRFLYLLLTARGRVVLSIDATGFKDTRLAATVIPWNAIQSLSPYTPYRSRNPTGIAVVIDPAFKRTLSIRPNVRFSNFGPAVCLDTKILDADYDEILRVANTYLPRPVPIPSA